MEIIERSASARRHAVVLLVLATALVPVAIFAATAGAASSTTKVRPKVCGSVGGPHWSWGGRSGAEYNVYAVKGAPCSVALRAAAPSPAVPRAPGSGTARTCSTR